MSLRSQSSFFANANPFGVTWTWTSLPFVSLSQSDALQVF